MVLSAELPLSGVARGTSSQGAAEHILPGILFSPSELEDLSQLLYGLGLYLTARGDEYAAGIVRDLSNRVEARRYADLISSRDWMQARLPLEPVASKFS